MLDPVDIDPIGHDEIGEEDDKWDDDLMNDLKRRFEELRHFNSRLETCSHEEFGDIKLQKNKVKVDTIELVANQIYDTITKLINDRRKRLDIKGGADIEEPNIVNYDSFDPDESGNLAFVRKNEVIDFGNINEGLNSLLKWIRKLGVNRVKSMGVFGT